MARPDLAIDAQIEVPFARVQIVQIHHPEPDLNEFRREGMFWVDLCLTPRRPNASASYLDRWGSHRSAELGSLCALPPNERILLRSLGGSHASLICQLECTAVERHLPSSFNWTDRRREACLAITHPGIRSNLIRLNQELRRPSIGSQDACAALVAFTGIEIARFLCAIDEPDEKGGFATWRQRIISERLLSDALFPTPAELADLCKLSPRQFRRCFKVTHGCSISEYLSRARIELAKRRLVREVPIQEIAEKLGYSSQSNFTSAFRRETGSTPNQFRTRVQLARESGAINVSGESEAGLREAMSKSTTRSLK